MTRDQIGNTPNADNRRRRWTPLIFRTGLLYSYPRTFTMVVLVTLIEVIISSFSGVDEVIAFLSRPWWVVWLVIWMVATFIVKRLVRGLVCLFGVPDDKSIDTWYSKKKILNHTCIKSYEETLAYSIAMKEDYDYSKESRKPIPQLLRALFEKDEDFKNYRKKVSDVLFSPWELLLGVTFFLIYFSLWWYPTSQPWLLLGESGLLVHWVIITIFWFIEAMLVASFAKLYIAMIKGTYLLSRKPKGLRIYKYLQFLDRRGKEKNQEYRILDKADKEVVDFEIFVKLTKPIGRVFTHVAIGLIGLLIVLDIYWIFIIPPADPSALIYPILTLILVISMFVLPQIGMHGMLSSYKTVINQRLVRTRMFTNTRLLKGTSSLPKNMDRVDQELEPFISLHKTVLDILDSMIEKLGNTSTWTFDTSMIVRVGLFVAIDMIPISIGVLQILGIL